ncbi:nuclear receptor coactivator 4 isoform X2 [Mugil cephalus]|uniref:nuclear receptor coactivator 4 isoform X2 n=1 Tax=Mugil cephalus TaxID=48193 RepID=UPI001FB78FD2|nr:nuclear receptor coactivator 4 isoform X2 [Mugil cephalus]
MTSKPRVHGKVGRMAVASGLKQCQQAQDQLEDAISSVTRAEQQLRENAREVRLELQSCVSRQQEALRCREVWLLGQIELLEQVKTETLQQQLLQLHRVRGQFDVIEHQLQNCNSNDLNNQLKSCMEKLSSLSLTPEETPEMSFHADTRSLRQAITSFGSVAAQVSPAQSSQSPTQSFQSPTHQTAQNQKTDMSSLGDWLLGPRPANSDSPPGFQSSTNPQDWLLAHQETKTSCPILAQMDFLQAWGQLRDLEAWLLQAPGGRERTDSSSSSFSIEKIDESEFTSGLEEDEEELSDWLLTPPTVAMETMTDGERWHQVLKPFESSWASSEWLSESSRLASDCSSCRQSARPLEIENLGQLKCLKTPPSSGPASPGPLEAWLQQAVPVPQTCKANELCSTYSHCVSEENCGKEALSRWLLLQDGRDKNGVAKTTKTGPFLRDQDQKVQAILEAWLHPSTTSSCSSWVAPDEEKGSRENQNFSSSSSPFQCPMEPNMWVLREKTSGPPGPAGFPPGPPSPPGPAEEEDKWLLKKRNQVQVQERLAMPTMCDLFSCLKVGGDKDKWLHRTPVQM